MMESETWNFMAALVVCLCIGALCGGAVAERGPPCCECPRGRLPPGYKNQSELGLEPGAAAYKVHWEWVTWFAAKAACEREGGDLVVLNSQAEAAMVQRLMNTYNGINYFHVGFLDVTADGTYVTVLGDRLSSSGYNAWAPGEPNQVGRENCGAIHKVNGLSDVLCKRELPFVCELPQ